MTEVRLLPVNALLALLTPGDVNPAALATAGFRTAGLEIPALGSHGKAVIDLLLVHEATNHLVACESKSGANVEEPQAKAYAGLSAAGVVQAASLSLKAAAAPTLEVMYLCREMYADRIRLGLKTLGLDFPVFAIGGGRIVLHDSQHASELLAAPFAGGIDLDFPPARLIPFDAESPASEIAPRVFAELVALLARRTPQISLTSLTENTVGHYGFYGHAAQNRLKSAVGAAVRAIVAAEPDRFAFDQRTGSRPEPLIRFLKTPEDFDPRGRTQGYQALGRSRRPAGDRRTKTNSDQLDLLRELEPGDNDDDEPSFEDAGEDGHA